MRIKIVILVMVLLVGTLAGVNNMPLIASMEGEGGNGWFGYCVATLDFNGDGIDDLVTASCGADSTGWGRIYVYFGGAGFDNIPDLTKTASYYAEIGYFLYSAGDVNGDGYDDLLSIEYPENAQIQQYLLRFYYGGPNPDMQYDHEIVINRNTELMFTGCLGDINNDNCDDFGFLERANTSPDTLKIQILLGGSFQIVRVPVNNSPRIMCSVRAVGDVNGDSLSDFVLGYAENVGIDLDYPRYRYLYFGSNGLDLSNRLLLYSTDLNMADTGAFGIGDFNGDGLDDFLLGSMIDNTEDFVHFKMSSLTLPDSPEYNMTVSPGCYPTLMHFGDRWNAHGDFNGDGFSDVVGTNFEAYMWAGTAGVWLGKASPNGLSDLEIHHPNTSPYHQFGWSVTTGDYNNDGYCDIAISAPQNQDPDSWYPGWVYVFAGNPQLSDTTVGNDDQSVAALSGSIKLTVYPNPVKNHAFSLNYQLEGDLPKTAHAAELVIYNIRGQVVAKQTLSKSKLGEKGGKIQLRSLSSAVYIAAVNMDHKRLATTKFTIK